MDPKELLKAQGLRWCIYLSNCEGEGTRSLMRLVVYYRDKMEVLLVGCSGDVTLQ